MFNIRVYGIMINEQNQLLVADEYIRGGYYTKFPGGGLEFGEGTRDCLKREFKEEMNLDVEIGDHIYTTNLSIGSVTHSGLSFSHSIKRKVSVSPVLLYTSSWLLSKSKTSVRMAQVMGSSALAK